MVAAGRCSPIIAGNYCALSNGLAGISVSSHTTTTSIFGGGGTSGNNSNCNIINKPKSSLSPLQRLPISGNLSTYGSSGGGGVGFGGGGGGVGGSGPGFTLLTGSNSHLSNISPALSASTPLSSGMSGGSNNATNYLSSMKLLGPASIDLGTTPLTHRNYSTIKGFSFRRSFDDKIIAPLNSSSSSAVAVGSGGGIGGHSNYLTHHHFHTHFHHPTSAMQKQSSIDRHISGGGGSGVGIMSHSTHYPLTSSQSSTKLSYRDDFLQQIGYLPTTRIFNTSIDEDRQQEFLSLSMSPPLNRRRDMPALRGIISL